MATLQQIEAARDMSFVRAVVRDLLVPSGRVCRQAVKRSPQRAAEPVRRRKDGVVPMGGGAPQAGWWPTPGCQLSPEEQRILARVGGEPMSWEAP